MSEASFPACSLIAAEVRRAVSIESHAWGRVVGALEARREATGQPVCAYVYDLATLRARARDLRRALSPWAMYYAVKANGQLPVLRALAPLVDGFEVASLGEARRAREAVPGSRLIFSGPGKTDRDLRGALELGLEVLNVESETELRRVQWLAEGLGVRVPVALRVNSRRRLASGSLQMTGVPSQFGIDEDAVGEAIELGRRLGRIELRGFHFHAVSNNLDAGAHAGYVEWCLRFAARQAADHDLALSVVNVGGGLGVDYGGGSGFDLEVFAETAAKTRPPAGVQVVLEPGRLVAAACGFYAVEVIDLKRTHGERFAVVRGGIHHFRLPTAPYIGAHGLPFAVAPIESWTYPFPRPELAGVAITVAGELCTPRDVLARDAVIERLRVGDLVVFPLAGAYGWEISHRDFLAHPHPDLIFIDSPGSSPAGGGRPGGEGAGGS